jgi:putative ABC transport system permease protein
MMFKNFFKIALRNLLKSRIYSFINIFGLAVGLTCFTLIYIFIKNELNYDTFHEKGDRIYRPVEIQRHPGVGEQHVAVTMGPLASALKEEFPEIIESCRIMPGGNMFFQLGGRGFYEENVSFADPEVFQVFTIPFIKGENKNLLKDPNTMVISEEIAKKFFGDDDPVGKSISVHHQSGVNEMKVTGVIKDYPENSHLNFKILISYVTIEPIFTWLKTWYTNSLATYIVLQENVSITGLEQKFPEFLKKHRPKDTRNSMDLYLQPLKDIHLHSNHIVYQTYNHNQGNINTVYTFSVIALFILLIACINYMNLSTARSVKRAKEVGMRKVLGSDRRSLVLQFLSESLLLSVLALLFARLFVEVTFPYLSRVLADRLTVPYYNSLPFTLEIVGITVLIGILAGSYPAFFLSSFQPIVTLKGNFSRGKQGAVLRKVLVVSQFAIAIGLIASTGIVRDQLKYIKNKDLGYSIERVVYLPLRTQETRSKYTILKNELIKHSNIMQVSATSGLTGAGGSQGTMELASEEETTMMMRFSHIGYDYLETMGMRILEGRNFSREIASDTITSIIINETAVKEFGWENPIGKQFKAGEDKPNYVVIGVVNDFYFYTFHQKIEPLIIWVDPKQCDFLIAKISPFEIDATLAYIEDVWEKQLPGFPFELSFLDEHFERIYQRDQNTGTLFSWFAAIAISIACLGQFGLASFTVEQKSKEIGIRKVLGASVPGIINMLIKDLAKWVLIASIIGIPIAYYAMQDWLGSFVYRTNMNIFTFILSIIVVLLIALLTVSYQSIRASQANPVKALRYE